MNFKIIISFLLLTILTFVLLPIVNNSSQESTLTNQKDLDLYNPNLYRNAGFLGDSITRATPYVTDQNDGYANLLSQSLYWDHINYGVGGSQIAYTGDNNSFVERYVNMDSNLDTIIIYGGINDYNSGTSPLGTSNSFDQSTFYGSVNILFTGLKNNYPNANIYVVTPFKRIDDHIPNPTTGGTLEDYVNILISATNKYKYNLIDLFNDWIFDTQIFFYEDTYTVDALHFNESGHEYLADFMYTYFVNNLIDYSTLTPDTAVVGTGTPPDYTITLIDFSLTDFIPVKSNFTYVYSNDSGDGTGQNRSGAYYDENYNYITDIIAGGVIPYETTVPSNAKFIRLNLSDDVIDKSYFYKKTLFNDVILDDDAPYNLVSFSGFSVTTYINVENKNIYTFSNISDDNITGLSRTGVYYDSDFNAIVNINGNQEAPFTFRTPLNVSYVRLNLNNDTMDNNYLYSQEYSKLVTYQNTENLLNLFPLLFVLISITSIVIYIKIKN